MVMYNLFEFYWLWLKKLATLVNQDVQVSWPEGRCQPSHSKLTKYPPHLGYFAAIYEYCTGVFPAHLIPNILHKSYEKHTRLGLRLMGLRREPFRGLLSSLQISNEGCRSEPEKGEQSSAFITGLFCNLRIRTNHGSLSRSDQSNVPWNKITTRRDIAPFSVTLFKQ